MLGLYDPAHEKDSCGVGFVAHIRGAASHQILVDADEMLQRMDHRGACGCEPNTGDGAGILTALPHGYFSDVVAREFGAAPPPPGHLAVGNLFLPVARPVRQQFLDQFQQITQSLGLQWLGWRPMPIDFDGANLGHTARQAAPFLAQVFLAAREELGADDLARKLYWARKQSDRILDGFGPDIADQYYCCSLSARVIVYKGMLTSWQLRRFYADLRDPSFTSHLAMVHSRFSTNTFPAWHRAQPLRSLCHNGEINTLRGNIHWMRAREGSLRSTQFPADLAEIRPIIESGASDSGALDNVLELLVLSGRSLPEAIMMLIPEVWHGQHSMPEAKRAFYEFHSSVMEPWDGPASIVFTDGSCIGAILDRNGLRPARYYVTHDDRVIMASEVGVLGVPAETVKQKGRLHAGWMFLVDFQRGRIVPDDELKLEIASRRPYAAWLQAERLRLADLPKPAVTAEALDDVPARMKALGYTSETAPFMLLPLVREQRDPIGSMGNDAAPACLSDQPRLLYDYFRQLFAQVTNPAIDPIREEGVMSLACFIGPEGNLLDPQPQDCHRLGIEHPILTDEELAALRELDYRGWRSRSVDITFLRDEGTRGLRAALDRICEEVDAALADPCQLVILTDRALQHARASVGSLLACATVHHHLIRRGQRTRLGLVVESGDAREVHHHCLLIGYGADAINPYLAMEVLDRARQEGQLDTDRFPDRASLVAAYRYGVAKGILKVMAKMGISTLQSYKGAQVFEAVGLRDEIIERSFVGTASRIQGLGWEALTDEILGLHARGYPDRRPRLASPLPSQGDYAWRPDGELHAWDPTAIAQLQGAARGNSREAYRRFREHMIEGDRRRCTLRGILDFKPPTRGARLALEDVEPAQEIVRRFCTGAMSLGSISAEAHETLAIAMNRIGAKSNTGEGGEDSARFQPLANGDSRRSAIKQVASGRFGVTIHYLTNADELQIKIAQGAKPGEGGELPGGKVDATIARIRCSTPGVGLISPPPHHDIYSIEDLKQLIYDLKNANPQARVSVKLVSEVGVGTIAAGVAKGFADHIVIAGDTGGTGASPLTSIKHAGLPWELGLAETHQTLVLNDLRSRVVLQTDGGLRTGRDVVIAALLGAEEMGFATAPLIALGCIMMRKCHLNTCPVGIATQDPQLRKKFLGQPEHVINYLFLVAEDVREWMATYGFRRFHEMVGRCDLLHKSPAIRHRKIDGIDLSRLLTPARPRDRFAHVYCTRKQDHPLHWALDNKIIERARTALVSKTPVRMELPVYNRNRAVGTMLSHHIAWRYGAAGLPDGTIHVRLVGSAGQSLGAFLARGVTLELEGDANDFVGKGLSGGRLIIFPPAESTFRPEENILVGNVALYGATAGEVFLNGRAAERFGVRNSGANVVVEGVGDHGCEYMTGGCVVILGETGVNFGAGMTGGMAYVWDPNAQLAARCNAKSVRLEACCPSQEPADSPLLSLLKSHHQLTGSAVAGRLLQSWPTAAGQFVKVLPAQ